MVKPAGKVSVTVMVGAGVASIGPTPVPVLLLTLSVKTPVCPCGMLPGLAVLVMRTSGCETTVVTTFDPGRRADRLGESPTKSLE